MTTQPFTLDDVRRILNECAGVWEGIDLDGAIIDTPFDQLGYESLALLETAGRIEREFGVSLDDVLSDLDTPHDLIEAVNSQLTEIARP